MFMSPFIDEGCNYVVIKLHNKHAGHDMAMTNWFLPMFKHLILIILLNIIWKGFKKLFIYQDKPI